MCPAAECRDPASLVLDITCRFERMKKGQR